MQLSDRAFKDKLSLLTDVGPWKAAEDDASAIAKEQYVTPSATAGVGNSLGRGLPMRLWWKRPLPLPPSVLCFPSRGALSSLRLLNARLPTQEEMRG